MPSVVKKIEDRKEIIKLLKDMYKVRSSMIHHAVIKEVDLEKLRKLQVVVLLLLSELISRLNEYSTKREILEEIDIEILKAY